jgi:hypothetical protein
MELVRGRGLELGGDDAAERVFRIHGWSVVIKA